MHDTIHIERATIHIEHEFDHEPTYVMLSPEGTSGDDDIEIACFPRHRAARLAAKARQSRSGRV